MQDLMAVELVPELMQAGVSCFKIEGRLKGPEYVALTTKAYRRAVDIVWEAHLKQQLQKKQQLELQQRLQEQQELEQQQLEQELEQSEGTLEVLWGTCFFFSTFTSFPTACRLPYLPPGSAEKCSPVA